MKGKKARLLGFVLLLLVSLTFSSCKEKEDPVKVQKKFDKFVNNMFIEEVQSDTLSLNYSLSNPEAYGIKPDNVTLGEYTADYMEEMLVVAENDLSKLQSFPYHSLTKEQQLTYDILKEYLESNLSLGNYTYYMECLGPTTGIQAQLPILLAEYNFYDKEDIDNYIKLLPCVYDYFKEIAAFEREKSKKGLFMNDKTADAIINQCDTFIADPDNNFLIDYFADKISGYKGLTKEEINSYIEANKKGVKEYIIPAYELLIDTLLELKGTGVNDGGLCNFPEGKKFYEELAASKTGSNRSMEELAKMLDDTIGDGMLEISKIASKDPDSVDKFVDFTSFPLTDPNEILSDLKNDIETDFPSPVPVNCTIKYVPESLAEHLSPAMYLVPAMDNYKNNNIYINGDDKATLSTIYTTVAHEGYPGHLYQCVYFRNKKPAPIRNILNFLGYDEGWATYVEYLSYDYSGIDKNLADLMAINSRMSLCIYSRADIGIHYEGWSKNTAVSYIKSLFQDEQIAESIYDTLLEEPAVYLPYAIGYLEINNLKEKAESKLGDDFNVKDFHKFLLDIGPSQFDIIEDRMDLWIKAHAA